MPYPFRLDLIKESGSGSNEDGKIDALFADMNADKPAFYKALRERIPKLYKATLEAEDPNDPSNIKSVEFSRLRVLL